MADIAETHTESSVTEYNKLVQSACCEVMCIVTAYL